MSGPGERLSPVSIPTFGCLDLPQVLVRYLQAMWVQECPEDVISYHFSAFFSSSIFNCSSLVFPEAWQAYVSVCACVYTRINTHSLLFSALWLSGVSALAAGSGVSSGRLLFPCEPFGTVAADSSGRAGDGELFLWEKENWQNLSNQFLTTCPVL